MQASLVVDALRMAYFRRRPESGLIVHSDRGSQYCGHDFRNALKGYAMLSSMSRIGDCWDNAPTESLWGHLKVARLHGRRFATRREAMDEVIDWLGFYNSTRPHQTLDYVSPIAFEQRWFAAQQQDRKTAQWGDYEVRFSGATSRSQERFMMRSNSATQASASTRMQTCTGPDMGRPRSDSMGLKV